MLIHHEPPHPDLQFANSANFIFWRLKEQDLLSQENNYPFCRGTGITIHKLVVRSGQNDVKQPLIKDQSTDYTLHNK